MAKVHINRNDIERIIKNYSVENNTFMLRSYMGNEKKKICKFNLNGKECAIDIFIKAKHINLIPKGKNVDESNLLINYIANKGYDASNIPEQFTMPCTETTLELLEQHIMNELNGIVTFNKSNHFYKISGYNGDTVTLHFYPTTEKILIQGRPYQAYSVLMSFFASLPYYDFEDIINMSTQGKASKNEIVTVREKMKNKLGKSYEYLDEALLKSISGSISMIIQLRHAEDYTGCLTGAFKALEGYLKKILSNKFEYRLHKSNTFRMFHRENGSNNIDLNKSITSDSKKSLNDLYKIYSNKRNVYLHSTIDPSFTRIIKEKSEAENLLYEILNIIGSSYVTIFGKGI